MSPKGPMKSLYCFVYILKQNRKKARKRNRNWGKMEQLPCWITIFLKMMMTTDDFIRGQQAKKTIDANKYSMNTLQRFLENEKITTSPCRYIRQFAL